MSDFTTYMESVKTRAGIPSNAQLAGRLGVSGAHVSTIMNGIGWPSDDFCIKLAGLVGDDPAKVLLIAHASKASEKARPVWEKIIKQLTAAALLVLLVTLAAIPAAGMTDNAASVYYVKSIVLAVLVLLVLPSHRIPLPALLIVAALSGCGSAASDDTAVVRVVQTADAPAICEAITKRPGAVACCQRERMNEAGERFNRCTIWIRPEDVLPDTPGILGHELRHCIDSTFLDP